MKKVGLAIALCLIAGNLTVAVNPPLSWWPSYGYDNTKNAVCPWQFAPPILEDKAWSVKFETGIWSQPVASVDKIYFLPKYTSGVSKDKSSIVPCSLIFDSGFGKEFKKLPVDVIESSEPNLFDSPVATPALAMLENGKTAVIYGDWLGKVVRFVDGAKDAEITLGKGLPVSSSATVFDGKIFVSASGKRTYVVDLENFSKEPVELKTKGLVTACASVWNQLVLCGDNLGNFYIFDWKTGNNIAQIKIPDIDTIRSSACITTFKNQTYAIFGSDNGKLHRIRLDDSSFELNTYNANTDTEFWATPTCIDGYAYVGNENGYLYKIDIEKMVMADRIKLDYPIFSQAVTNNGFLYVTTANREQDLNKFAGSLFIIDLSTFKPFSSGSSFSIDGGAYVSPIFAANRLFVASRSGKVYCFKGMQPDVKISPGELDFDSIAFDSQSIDPISISVTNATKYTSISGTVRTEPPSSWLKVSTDKISNNTKIEVSVDPTKCSSRSGTISGNIIINYQFGLDSKTVTIPVKAILEPPPPKFVLNKSSFTFNARSQAQIIDSLKVSLSQFDANSELNFEVSSSDSWFEVGSKSFKLNGKSGQSSADVWIKIDPEKLMIQNRGKTEYSGQFTIQGIVRGKPYNPVTIKVSLSIEKDLVLVAIPMISDQDGNVVRNLQVLDYEPEYSGSVDFNFTNASNSGQMTIKTKPAVTYEGEKIAGEWISLPKLPIDQQDFKLRFTIGIKAKGFQPGKTYKATIQVVFQTGSTTKTVPLHITINALVPDSVKIKFIIGSPNYWVNDTKQSDVISPAPYISSKGNTMVPLRPISGPLGHYYGATLIWQADIQTVIFTMGDKSLRLIIGHDKAYIDNPDGSIEEMSLSSPPEVRNGKTFIPPKILADTFNGRTSWDAKTKTVVFEFIKPR